MTSFDLADATVVVTGAAGFIGSYVTAHLVAAGARVVAVDKADTALRPHLADTLAHPAVIPVETADRWPYRISPGVTPTERFAEVLPFLDQADAVVHFAYCNPDRGGRSLSPVARLAAEFRLNVLPSLDLIELLGPDVTSLCFASSGLVYGRGHRQPVTEDSPARGDTPYGLGKLAVEQAVTAWTDRAASRHGTSLRIVTVYGPGETAPRAVPNFIRRGLAGLAPQIAVADDRRDYTAVADVAAGAVAVVANHLGLIRGPSSHGNADPAGNAESAGNAEPAGPAEPAGTTGPGGHSEPCDTVLNIATGRTLSTREVAQAVLSHLGSDLEPEIGPADREPLQHRVDAARLRAQTGWEPSTRLEDGLVDEVAWFRDRPDLW